MFGPVGLPHGCCFLWNPELLWLHVASDTLIALIYFLIPVALARIVRRRKNIPYNSVFFCFAAFIVACGVTHVMEVVTLWHPIYWVSGVLKAMTAAVSVATLVLLVRVTPNILTIPDRLAHERFRVLIENAPDAILQVDSRGTIVIANRSAELIFGYGREELLGLSIDLLIPLSNRGVHRGHRDRFVKAGITRPMGEGLGDLHARRKDGSEISVEIALSRLQTDDGVHVTAVIRDVTERLRIERELEGTRLLLASVLDSTSVGICALDRNWIFTYVNENAKKLLRGVGDFVGKDLRVAFPDQRKATRKRLEQVMTTREPLAFESYYPPLDLSTNVSAHPLDDGGITIYFTDVTAQRRMDRELEERAQRIQRIEVLARLSSGLAHEIKNPLAIIHARASDLKELVATGEVGRLEIERTCASIVHTSDRAIRILRGVAAMARVGTHDPMRPEAVAGMVQQAVELVQGRYKVAGIRLQTEIPEDLPMLQCREVQIGQILVNLLNNAFDAVDGQARGERWVRVVVSVQPGAEHDHMDWLQISVIDSGPGVAPEHKERVMQTFFTTKSMGAGIGIGLSVSRTIAEEHGGLLRLCESDGHTCFCLTLPIEVGQTREAIA